MDEANPHPRISTDPAIMVGKPCIKGTRIPVYIVLDYLAGGADVDEIISAFPRLTEADIRAAISYGAYLAGSSRHEQAAE